MVCGRHVRFTRKLNKLAKFRVCQSKIWSGHIDKVSETADNATVTTMEDRVRIRITVLLAQTSIWSHWSKGRYAISVSKSVEDIHCEMLLGQNSGACYHVAFYFTSQIH